MTPAFCALADVLAQVTDVVRTLSDRDYRAPGPVGVSGSIGQHVRHCLDHVHALEHGTRTGAIDYDTRERGGSIESDRHVAIRTLDTTASRLRQLDGRLLYAGIHVTTQLTTSGERLVVPSSIGRELAFVISHTVHHSATINVMLQQRRAVMPPEFGFAASTLCAQSA
jgi:uncharacterized damage-inducible protein DinB